MLCVDTERHNVVGPNRAAPMTCSRWMAGSHAGDITMGCVATRVWERQRNFRLKKPPWNSSKAKPSPWIAAWRMRSSTCGMSFNVAALKVTLRAMLDKVTGWNLVCSNMCSGNGFEGVSGVDILKALHFVSCNHICSRQNSSQRSQIYLPNHLWQWLSHFWFANIIWISGLRYHHAMIVAIPPSHYKDNSCPHSICLILSSQNCGAKNRNIERPWPKFNHSWRRSGCISMPNFRPFVTMHSRKSLWSISLSQNCAKNSENHSPNDACNLQIWPVSFSYTQIKKINTPSPKFNYRKTSSISRAKSQNLNVSCILLQLSSFNPLKPGVKLKMKM